jgi:hypothetical protein
MNSIKETKFISYPQQNYAKMVVKLLLHLKWYSSIMSVNVHLKTLPLMCVYLSSGFKGQCFNYAIPIAISFPLMTSLPYLGLVVLPLWTPGGIWREGFPTSQCILVETPWQLILRQFHNLGTCPIKSSSQLRGEGCSDI